MANSSLPVVPFAPEVGDCGAPVVHLAVEMGDCGATVVLLAPKVGDCGAAVVLRPANPSQPGPLGAQERPSGRQTNGTRRSRGPQGQ
jgi:hypothetical protein